MAFARRLAREAHEQKGDEIRVLDVSSLLYITDFFLLITTHSARQSRAMAEALNQSAKEGGRAKGRMEGSHQSSWVLLDFGDVVVHILTDDARQFYRLDYLWADAPEVAVHFDDGESQAQAG